MKQTATPDFFQLAFGDGTPKSPYDRISSGDYPNHHQSW